MVFRQKHASFSHESPRSLFQADPVQQHHKGGIQQHDKDHWLGPHRFGIITFICWVPIDK